MKRSRKLLAFLLALLMVVSLVPTVSASAQEDVPMDDYPFIFVHGLFGWGERSDLDPILPYWGMTTGSLMDYLNSEGYECYAAQVGPLSGAWDRACELYAQLTGTRVDYGAAHSAAKGHDRYGITYDKPLFEGWSAQKKINLIGHSFGGATTRMFLDILTNGSQAEIDAAKAAGTEVSPFFEGGKGDWVYSLTAVAAPHNGTTFIESCGTTTTVATDFIYNFAAQLNLTKYKGVYDLQLEHFGISEQPGETDVQYLVRVLGSEEFMSHNDNAIYDLTIDNALDINDGIEIQNGIYYFSICGDATDTDSLTGFEVPKSNMFTALKPFARRMGRYYDKTTAGGYYIDKSWLPNDGMVNVPSGLYPFDSNGNCLKNNGAQGYVMKDATVLQKYDRGIWNVLPTVPYDHLSIVGGFNTPQNTHQLYNDLIARIRSTYTSTEPTVPDDGMPFTDVEKGRWSYDYIYKMYKAGVVNGITPTLFAPAENVTRGQFVTMLGRLAGADVSGYTHSRFIDVPDNTYYAPYIEWAAEHGIVLGVSPTEYAPNNDITREQIAAILYRYANYAGIDLTPTQAAVTFTDDAQISAYARESVYSLQRAGVITGYDNGNGTACYKPQNSTTREEACTLMCRISD